MNDNFNNFLKTKLDQYLTVNNNSDDNNKISSEYHRNIKVSLDDNYCIVLQEGIELPPSKVKQILLDYLKENEPELLV